MEFEKLPLQSADVAQINLDLLYQIAPSCFTEAQGADGKIKRVVNFTILRELLGDAAAGDDNNGGEEFYQFTWPGKAKARREAARAIRKTLRPVPEDSVDWDTTQNLYIEGDNLEVLKLLQKAYMGKVKMIYIDPPYNRGKDLVYHDDYASTTADYDCAEGNTDEFGNRYRCNTETNGRFHSDWCSMMYPRLQLARNLLTEDGVIFISLDDKEMDNLRKMCDEVFGAQNRLDRGSLIWVNRGSSKGFSKIVKNHEFILAYGKNAESVHSVFGENFASSLKELEHYCFNKPSEKNPYANVKFCAGCRIEGISDITFEGFVGKEVQLEIVEGVMEFKGGILQNDVVLRGTFPYINQINEYFINKPKGIPTYDTKGQEWLEIFFNSKGMPRYRKLRNNLIISSVIDEEDIPNYGSDEIKLLFGKKEIFPFPKPQELIFHLISYFLPNESIILDFFSGSATTAHAVMQLNVVDGGNRKFIMVQLPEPTKEDSVARKAGYKNICEIGKERIRRAGRKIKEEAVLQGQDLDTGFRVFRVDESNMQDVYFHPTALSQNNLELLLNNVRPDRTDLDLLFGAMLDWGVQLSLPMSKATIDGCDVYTVNDGELVGCFADDITENIISYIAEQSPERVLFRDSSFKSDADKINIFEQFKQRLGWSDEEAMKNIRVI